LSVLPSCNNPKAFATSSLCRSRYLLCICTEVCPEAFMAMSTLTPWRAQSVKAVFL
jgi:hypothetical protein